MLQRRILLAGLLAAASRSPASAAGRLGEDGLYQLDWYLDSFLDIAEDMETAAQNGKRLAILWGLKGCPACRQLHEVHLADPVIETYLRTHFEIVHLNHIGAREVTDLDGRKLREKALGEHYGIRFTPTVQFLPERADGLAARPPRAREVARMPGLLEPPAFLAMFRYVRERGYEAMPFPDWLSRQPPQRG